VPQAWLPRTNCKTSVKDALLLQVTLLFLDKNSPFVEYGATVLRQKRWPVVVVGTPVLRQNGVILCSFCSFSQTEDLQLILLVRDKMSF
jgi:hypothetical protein